MAKLNVPPTKSNLRMVRQTHNTAREGYNLLEQKREIMIMELMSYLERVKRVEKDLDKILTEAYSSLKKGITSLGYKDVEDRAKFISYNFEMRKKSTKLVGMNLPSIEITNPKLDFQYSFLNTTSHIDDTATKFLNLIPIIREMAEIRAIIWRLSAEVKKTQRRVNALDKVVIPQSVETIKFIQDTLEERERDETFITKMVKNKYGGNDETDN
jgi:V/A-type H+-transporting ATPase subunit D